MCTCLNCRQGIVNCRNIDTKEINPITNEDLNIKLLDIQLRINVIVKNLEKIKKQLGII